MKRLAVALLAGVVALSACSKPSQTGGEGGRVNSWTIPHVLRYANAEDVATLNPMLLQDVVLAYMSSLTAAFLVKWDHRNLPYAELATEVPTQANGGVSKDGLTITYHLRKGLRWSDGAPLDADDVIWTYHAIMNPANNVVSRTGWDLITKIDEPDKYTVTFHLKQPYSPFIVTFFSSAGANPSILPKHLLAQYPNINTVAFNSLPIGAGPFKYKEWLRGQKVVMVPNPYYFRGQPKLKEVDFMIIPNRDTIFTQLAAHELDLWVHVGGVYYVRLSELGGYEGLNQPSYQWNHIDFNLTHPGVSDPVVRYAMELALDRATVVAKHYHGLATLQEGIAPKTAPYYDPNIPLVPYDPKKANAPARQRWLGARSRRHPRKEWRQTKPQRGRAEWFARCRQSARTPALVLASHRRRDDASSLPVTATLRRLRGRRHPLNGKIRRHLRCVVRRPNRGLLVLVRVQSDPAQGTERLALVQSEGRRGNADALFTLRAACA